MPALAYVNGPVARVLTVVVGSLVVGVIVVDVAVVTAPTLGRPVISKAGTQKWTRHVCSSAGQRIMQLSMKAQSVCGQKT